MGDVKTYYPEFTSLQADTNEIEYQYTLNSVKDSLLDN